MSFSKKHCAKSPFKQKRSPYKRCWKGYKPNPDGRPASQQGSCVKK